MFEKIKAHFETSYRMAQSMMKVDAFSKDESAVTQIMINGVTGIVAVVIALLIGALIIAKLSPKIVGNSNESNDTIASIVSSGYGALDIATILPYVAVAGIAILILLLYFGGRSKEM